MSAIFKMTKEYNKLFLAHILNKNVSTSVKSYSKHQLN